MGLDFRQIYSDLYARAATASAGSALRALVGSIFRREGLNALAGKTLPYLVWSEQPVAGSSGDLRDVNAAWWIYVAPGTDNRALYQIATALDTLYGSANQLALDRGRIGVTHIGQPFFDDALALRGLEIRIGFRALG